MVGLILSKKIWTLCIIYFFSIKVFRKSDCMIYEMVPRSISIIDCINPGAIRS